jgi:hypothetical protein
MIVVVAPPSLCYKPKINKINMVLVDVICKWRHMAQVNAKKISLQDIINTIRKQYTNEIKTYIKDHVHCKYLTKFVKFFQIGFV